MPGWYYVILHICFLGLYSIIAFHMLDIPKLSFWKGHKWKELWAAYDGIGCVFFASGYYDLVGSPPRNWMQIGRSISTVLAVYVLYHLIQSAIGHAKFSLADLWPVAALLVYRTICWPLRLISRMECFPSWTESAMTSALAIAAFVVVNACFFDHVAECLTPSIPYEPWPFALGFGSDAVVLFSQNRLLYYFLYAAHPPLLDFFWSNAWLPPPAKLSNGRRCTKQRLRAIRLQAHLVRGVLDRLRDADVFTSVQSSCRYRRWRPHGFHLWTPCPLTLGPDHRVRHVPCLLRSAPPPTSC